MRPHPKSGVRVLQLGDDFPGRPAAAEVPLLNHHVDHDFVIRVNVMRPRGPWKSRLSKEEITLGKSVLQRSTC